VKRRRGSKHSGWKSNQLTPCKGGYSKYIITVRNDSESLFSSFLAKRKRGMALNPMRKDWRNKTKEGEG